MDVEALVWLLDVEQDHIQVDDELDRESQNQEVVAKVWIERRTEKVACEKTVIYTPTAELHTLFILLSVIT